MTNALWSEAVAFISDDALVWSDDFETIRQPLADLLTRLTQVPSHQFDSELDNLCSALLGDLPTVSDPMESWLLTATRELAVYRDASRQSVYLADGLKKLFGFLDS